MSGALGNVRSYEFGDYEVVYYCVIHSSWEVGGERVVCFLIFVCGGAATTYENQKTHQQLGEGWKRSFAMVRVW